MTARVVALVGPTASGKSALALRLAERVGAEIVSADARQVYCGLDVGTAKPTAEERARVRHHCLDLADPTEPFDVARWAAAAEGALARAEARGQPVVVVGGTGLYVRVLLHGLCAAAPGTAALRAALRVRAAERGRAEMRRWLCRLDPEAADRIHPNDDIRTVRAVEVALSTGVPLSRLQSAHGFAERRHEARVVVLTVPPPLLATRIEMRTDAMLDAGWVDEVRALSAWLPDDAPGWRTLGYRELRDHVRGGQDLVGARQAVLQATRRFAKRQRTWWRRETREGAVVHLDPTTHDDAFLDEAAAFLVANRASAG